MPLDTVLCLDTSGSMGWNNNEGINQLKAAALKFLEGVEETARQANLKVGLERILGFIALIIVKIKAGVLILSKILKEIRISLFGLFLVLKTFHPV